MVHLIVRQCPYLCRVVQRGLASPVWISQDCFAPCWVKQRCQQWWCPHNTANLWMTSLRCLQEGGSNLQEQFDTMQCAMLAAIARVS